MRNGLRAGLETMSPYSDRPRSRSELTSQVGSVFRAAVRGLRKFAYATPQQRRSAEKSLRRPLLGLALGGGFARGLAHIGVLKVLLENRIPIDSVAGTSIGSIVAAAPASGCAIDEMAAAARKVRWSSIARWTFPRFGFATNEPLRAFLSKALPCRTFEQLKLSLAIVAADLRTGEEVIFREGELLTPLRASCSFPGLFVPVEYRGRLLIDGAFVNSVPVSALSGVDAVVAVNIRSNGLERCPTSLFEIVGESFRITQNFNQSSWRDRSDLVIEPELKDFRWGDFGRSRESIAAGERAAQRALPALRDLLRQRIAEGVGKSQERRLTLPATSARWHLLP